MWTPIRIALTSLALLSGPTSSWGQAPPPRMGDLVRIPVSSSGTIAPGNPGGNPMPAIRADRWAEAEQIYTHEGRVVEAAGAHECALIVLKGYRAELDDPAPRRVP